MCKNFDFPFLLRKILNEKTGNTFYNPWVVCKWWLNHSGIQFVTEGPNWFSSVEKIKNPSRKMLTLLTPDNFWLGNVGAQRSKSGESGIQERTGALEVREWSFLQLTSVTYRLLLKITYLYLTSLNIIYPSN